MERKDSCSYLPQDDQSTGNFWLAKTFLISFLLRPVALLSLGRVRILFPLANCPSGEWKIFVLRGCVSTPEGQKIFTLLKDNWQKETKFVLSRGTTRPAALKERKMKKVFAIPQYPHPLVISCQIKSTFFSYDHTIFLDGCVELAVRFCTKKRLMICWRRGAAPGCCCWRSAPSWTQRSRKTRKGKTRILEVATWTSHWKL